MLPPFPISNIYHQQSHTCIEHVLGIGHKNKERIQEITLIHGSDEE